MVCKSCRPNSLGYSIFYPYRVMGDQFLKTNKPWMKKMIVWLTNTLEWAIPEKIPNMRVEDILFWKPPWNFLLSLLYPWTFQTKHSSSPGYALRCWIPNPWVLCSKPLGGSKVDSAFHPSEVGKMSTRNFWELSGKK